MKSELGYSQLDYPDRQTIAISREIARNSGGNGYSCRYAPQRQTPLQAGY